MKFGFNECAEKRHFSNHLKRKCPGVRLDEPLRLLPSPEIRR